MADRDSCKKRDVWSPPKEKQFLLICSELEIAGQLDVCATSASVSLPILILNLRLLKVQPGRELSREPFNEQLASNISRTRINGSFRVLCKPRPG